MVNQLWTSQKTVKDCTVGSAYTYKAQELASFGRNFCDITAVNSNLLNHDLPPFLYYLLSLR